ncbi:MAG TPA: cell division protein ZapA [Balneolaceae bacterium]|nr:cell division protein ZapA [Balneolaceae bacterium]
MKSIKISILEKKYPLRVKESEEDTMRQIARYVDEKFKQYKKELSKQPESTVMVLAALSIAEELFEERQNNQKLDQQGNRILEDVNQSMEDLLEEIKS